MTTPPVWPGHAPAATPHAQPVAPGYTQPTAPAAPGPVGYAPQPPAAPAALPSLAGARVGAGGSYFTTYGTYVGRVTKCAVNNEKGMRAYVSWEILETDAPGEVVGVTKDVVWEFAGQLPYGAEDIRAFVTGLAEGMNTGFEVTDQNVDQCTAHVFGNPSPALGSTWKILAFPKKKKDGSMMCKTTMAWVPDGTVLGLTPAPVAAPAPAPAPAPAAPGLPAGFPGGPPTTGWPPGGQG